MEHLAEVHFRTYEERERAMNDMYRDCGGSKSYQQTSGTYERHYGLYITGECENVARARQICIIWNGKFIL